MKLETTLNAVETLKTFWELAKNDEKAAQHKLAKALKSDSVSEIRLEQTRNAKGSQVSATKLGELTSSKAPAGTIREGDALKQEQEVEKAKLKKAQLGESKVLYAKQEEQKKTFEKHQSEVKAKFLAKKPNAEQIAKFEKVQATDKKAFEAGLVKENIALYNKHKAQNQDQAKWHALQQKDLEAKYSAKPEAKPVSKLTAKPVTPKPAAKPVAVVELPVQDCTAAGLGIKVAPIDGTTDGLVYIPA